MARGWDTENRFGTRRIICANPPGPGGSVSAPGPGPIVPGNGVIVGPHDFIPNSFCGQMPTDAIAMPTVAPGINDFAIECWVAPRYLTIGGFNWELMMIGLALYTGAVPPFWSTVGGIQPESSLGRMSAVYNADPANPPAYVISITPGGWIPPRWMHLAVNFNRGGNQDFYVDGTLIDSDAIDNVNIGAEEFFYLAPRENDIAQNDRPGYRSGDSNASVVVGPIALHINTVLSAGQINDSVVQGTVQNTAATQIRWDARDIQGHTGWLVEPFYFSDVTNAAGRESRIVQGIKDYLYEVGAPLGAAGTVYIPDTSGNGNHYVLPTAEAYTQVVAEKANVGFFAAPPWWV